MKNTQLNKQDKKDHILLSDGGFQVFTMLLHRFTVIWFYYQQATCHLGLVEMGIVQIIFVMLTHF